MFATNFSTMALSPLAPLAPNDFSHSLGLLSRSLSSPQSYGCGAGSDAGSFCWAPITDTMKFLKWLVGYRPLRAMTESSFGKIVAIANAGGMDISGSPVLRTSFTYTGREWEEDVGLFYYRARWYDPSVGRFLQEDPEPGNIGNPQTVNSKYIYVANNPIMLTDAMGRDFLHDLGMAIVFVAAFASGAWIGGIAAGMLGFAAGTAGAAITATLVGIAVGGGVGAIAFPALGLGNSQQGFALGAIAGGLGGFARGMGWLDNVMGSYKTNIYKGDKLMSGIENKVNSSIKGAAGQGSANPTFSLTRGSEFAKLMGAIEPYVLGLGAGISLDTKSYECSMGNCNIPQFQIGEVVF